MKLTMDLVSALSAAPPPAPPSPPSCGSDRTYSSSSSRSTRSSARTLSSDDSTPTRTVTRARRRQPASSPSFSRANAIEDEEPPTYLALSSVAPPAVVRVEAVEDDEEAEDDPPRIYLALAVKPARHLAAEPASPVPRLRLEGRTPQSPPPLIGAPPRRLELMNHTQKCPP